MRRGRVCRRDMAHYTQDEFREIFAKRGFVVEDVPYILQGELIMAFRKKGQATA